MPSWKPDTAATAHRSVKGKDIYQPYLLEFSLMAEYRLLNEQYLPGVFVIPSANSQLVWFGVLFIRSGLYEGGVFKFTMFIPEAYPDADCPRLVFDQPIFHPLIDPVSGELDCLRAFQKWRRNVNHLWQVILYARRVFHKLDVKFKTVNPEASVLAEENPDLFQWRANQSVELCKSKLYDKPKIEDDHAIRFTVLDHNVFKELKDTIITPPAYSPNQARKGDSPNGISWMCPGSTQIFSRDDCG